VIAHPTPVGFILGQRTRAAGLWKSSFNCTEESESIARDKLTATVLQKYLTARHQQTCVFSMQLERGHVFVVT
jgi:hypothetical protein